MNANNIVTPKKSLSSESRYKILVSDEDLLKIKRGKRWKATVTDLVTGVDYDLAGCACSIPGCYCDAYMTDTRFSNYIEQLSQACRSPE
jgi:hypothetical protein